MVDALDRDRLTGGSKQAGDGGRLHGISPGRRDHSLVDEAGARAAVEDEGDGVHRRCLDSDRRNELLFLGAEEVDC